MDDRLNSISGAGNAFATRILAYKRTVSPSLLNEGYVNDMGENVVTEISIPIPLPLWPMAEDLRSEAVANASEANKLFPLPPPSLLSDDMETQKSKKGITDFPIASFLVLIHFLLKKSPFISTEIIMSPSISTSGPLDMTETSSVIDLLHQLFSVMFIRHLKNGKIDIHVLLANTPHLASDSESQQPFLYTFFKAITVLISDGRTVLPEDVVEGNGNLNDTIISLPKTYVLKHPAMLSIARDCKRGQFSNITINGLFGGQGSSEDYINELRHLVAAYGPILTPYLEQIGAALTKEGSSMEASVGLDFSAGSIDFLTWVMFPDTTPSAQYLLSAPISLPLFAIIQLAHYWVIGKCAEVVSIIQTDECTDSFLSIGTLNECFGSFVGHSQGVVGAVVCSAADSEESFIQYSISAVKLLFWMGLRCQEVYPATTVSPTMLEDSLKNGEGSPTPMMSVRNLPTSVIREYIDATNKHLSKYEQVAIGIINGPTLTVLSGPPRSLYAVNVALRKIKAKPDADQSRIPFSKRSADFYTSYLPVAVPFHSAYLVPVVPLVVEDMKRIGVSFRASSLRVPVADIVSSSEDDDITSQLVKLICVAFQDWSESSKLDYNVTTPKRPEGAQKPTHLVDFGPGGSSGVGFLTAMNKFGTGVQVVVASTLTVVGSSRKVQRLLPKHSLLCRDPSSIVRGINWGEKFAPNVLRRSCDDKLFLDTKFSRVLGKPPLMVAGMTPSTVHHEFVAACSIAGYHVELAGGGHINEKALRGRLDALMGILPPGEGITVNILFLNQNQWSFQYPLLLKLRREGYPIDGICIAAGVPSFENAVEIVDNVTASGIRHIAFKPGTAESILRVVSIAQARPKVHVLLQWTGGRAGGHHSFEDFSDPVFQTYAEIRSCPNIVLIAGSGIGNAEDSLQYLTGEWCCPGPEKEYARRPFDALLLGSRVMVAKECKTADEVKQCIVDAPGLGPGESWEDCYNKPTGGVVTVISELGEPIHKIATRGTILWKNFDALFSLPKPELVRALKARKKEIIDSLNKDYHRVWFGRKKDGTITDVESMTYEEVTLRMVELMYITFPPDSGKVNRWIDKSYRESVFDFIHRIEERFCGKISKALIPTAERLDVDSKGVNVSHPRDVLSLLFKTYTLASTSLLVTEDVLFFINLCLKRGRKPAPFIPILDENFQTFFKKDSLWQSEDLDSVPERDPQRVCILQGPIAVKYSTKINEPVKDILDGIHNGLVKLLLSDMGMSESSVPSVAYIGAKIGDCGGLPDPPGSSSSLDEASYRHPYLPFVKVHEIMNEDNDGKIVTLSVSKSAEIEALSSDGKSWINALCGTGSHTWLRALLTTAWYLQGVKVIENPLNRVVSHPLPGQKVVVRYRSTNIAGMTPEAFEVYDLGTYQNPSISCVFDAKANMIDVSITEFNKTMRKLTASASVKPLSVLRLQYRFSPTQGGYAPIHEVMTYRNQNIRDFYSKLWTCSDDAESNKQEISSCTNKSEVSLQTAVYTNETIIAKEDILKFCRVVGNQAELYIKGDPTGSKTITAPMDFSIVVGWSAMMKCLLNKGLDGDLLHLVHLSNGFTLLHKSRLLQAGDKVRSTARIASVTIEATGKTVEVSVVLSLITEERDPVDVVEITSKFFFRGHYDGGVSFKKIKEAPFELFLKDKKEAAVLNSKRWIKWKSDEIACRYTRPCTRLVFYLESSIQQGQPFKGGSATHIITTGRIETETSAKEVILVGHVAFDSFDPECCDTTANIIKCPVSDYFARVGKRIARESLFVTERSLVPEKSSFSSSVVCPLTNRSYAGVSGDLNPIHVNPHFAKLANLPTVITHGMWTSAACRRFVEIFAADNRPERVKSYEANFVDFVIPGDTLNVQLYHVGMRNGRKIIRIEAVNQNRTVVLKGVSEVEQPSTAFVFTGQGSQEVGMGTDLYNSSPVAKEIWDRADSQFQRQYGISILEIVRKNPKEKTVFFGGHNGAKIRNNYIRMTYEEPDNNGSGVTTKHLFPEITPDSDSYTFRSPSGLLYATQFTQPALTLMEKAAFEDMRSKGFVQEGSVFAGHSLGEYSALASIGEIIPVEALMDIVFYRGITMQRAVKRDKLGRSDFNMIAVNPSRVGKGFGERPLQFAVDCIAQLSAELIEIVNYNVQNWQYVVAGTRSNLATLTLLLNHIFAEKINIQEEMKKQPMFDFKSQIEEKVRGFLKEVKEMAAKNHTEGGYAPIQRGQATIPLVGIDVPFHSSYLYSGVAPFRKSLLEKIKLQTVNVNLLYGRYIPNVVATPFSLSEEFIKSVYQCTRSPIIEKILEKWKETTATRSTPEGQQKLGYTLLIELLSYQFASPVRWSETMDIMLKPPYYIDRLLEVGPSPVLTGMAMRTLKLKYEAEDLATNKARNFLCYTTDMASIYYEMSTSGTSAEPLPEKPKEISAPVHVTHLSVSAPSSTESGAASQVESSDPLIVLRTLSARKAKLDPFNITPEKSIRDLSAGKSTVQNEIVGEVQKEYGGNVGNIDKPEEASLKDLAAIIRSGNSAVAHVIGPVTSSMLSKLTSNKFPAGSTVQTAKTYFRDYYGLANSDGVLIHLLAMEPPKRLITTGEFNTFLDTAADSYSKLYGKSVKKGVRVPTSAIVSQPSQSYSSAPALHPDAPVSPADFIRVVVARKLKQPVSSITMNKSLRDLSSGKSTLQNEMVGELQKEFNVPEISAEIPLENIAAGINTYSSLGVVGKGLLSKLISNIMPAGVSLQTLKGMLQDELGFGPLRQDAVLLFACGMEPSKRLGTVADVSSFISSVSAVYCAAHKLLPLQSGIRAGGALSITGPAVGNYSISAKHLDFITRQIELHAQFLGINLREGAIEATVAAKQCATLIEERDSIRGELGDQFVDGINPIFSLKKARRYDSYWNWARQDLLEIYYAIVFERITIKTDELTRIANHVINRATRDVEKCVFHYVNACKDSDHLHHKVYLFGVTLLQNLKEHLEGSYKVAYRDIGHPTAPNLTITDAGEIVYNEVLRGGNRKLEEYVNDMRKGSTALMKKASKTSLNAAIAAASTRDNGKHRIIRQLMGSNGRPYMIKYSTKAVNKNKNLHSTLPYLMLKTKVPGTSGEARVCNQRQTKRFLDAAEEITQTGLSLEGKAALVTGCGKGSIGAEILKGLLAAGCKVIATTSSFSKATTEYFRTIYEDHGGKGSVLIVVPFNQASTQDVKNLMASIYDFSSPDGLGLDLDFLIPFAALPEAGRQVDGLDAATEVAHRLMLTNIHRLIGEVKRCKEGINSFSRPCRVVLPLSPNHGVIGGDGLYGESKRALETLFARWESESWRGYCTILGAVIGWTRGTGLMGANNIVAQGIEELGARTFSTQEMAFNILTLLHPSMARLSEKEPVWADFGGGLDSIPHLSESIGQIRSSINETSEIRKAVHKEQAVQLEGVVTTQPSPTLSPRSLIFNPFFPSANPRTTSSSSSATKVYPRANIRFNFPPVSPLADLKHLNKLGEVLDLKKTVVITGYGEVSPWGSARTRWEMEAFGSFSIEGCIEMAWMMGLIKHTNSPEYTGWTDAKTNEHVKDLDVKSRYEKEILAHSGIRLIESALFDGYDPMKKTFLQQVSIDFDMVPIEVSAEEAAALKRLHGDLCDAYPKNGDMEGQWMVSLKRGSIIHIPKAMQFDRLVAGQIPSGWDAKLYGVPDDIIKQVDPVTLYVIVSTVEALISSGITDPYEFYEYIHVTELGQTSGGGVGGIRSNQLMYRERFLDNPNVQSDILQETFINTMPAWVNLLLLSSSGHILTPIGACATAVESVSAGVSAILNGAAKVVIVGGYDDFSEESSYEFAKMNATSSSSEEFKKGREPRDMSRPAASSRDGFMEAHGAGSQVLMSAHLAFEMGLPIHGIIASVSTATDREGRSIPAPGIGIMSTARETHRSGVDPAENLLLDVEYRARQMKRERRKIEEWVKDEEAAGVDPSVIAAGSARMEAAALTAWGNEFYKDNVTISPLRGALAVFGLTVDDIGVASFHGTGTKANDLNESRVLNSQMHHLGRSPGNFIPAIFQKHLTGHPKGAAAAWMLTGVMQCLNTGLIPGNRNADNIDPAFREFNFVHYPSRTVKVTSGAHGGNKSRGLKAALLKSFGFGQVNGEILVIHPDYVICTLSGAAYNHYITKRAAREQKAFRHYHDSITTPAKPLVRVKNAPPYRPEDTAAVLLDPTIRATHNQSTNTWFITPIRAVDASPGTSNSAPATKTIDGAIVTTVLKPSPYSLALSTGATEIESEKKTLSSAIYQTVTQQLISHHQRISVGVDIEEIASIDPTNTIFVERNFSIDEVSYCQERPDSRASFTGRWCAKEAIAKAISSFADTSPLPEISCSTEAHLMGGGAAMSDIEVLPSRNGSGSPVVTLKGKALEMATRLGIKNVQVTISHTTNYASAVAIAFDN